ncbi:TonB-dependent siderophore receptor [Bordetella holmesii]|nr:TonB-dependent receptor [Bordetella holmesii]
MRTVARPGTNSQHQHIPARFAPAARPLCLRPGALAVALSLALASGLPAANAQATATQTQAARFTIPAGPLAPALRALASSANILLSFTEDQTRGKTTPGIQGSYTPDAALAALLAGSNLQAVQQDNGGYLLRALPSTTLPAVRVTGIIADDANTEGSGSYAATSATIGKIPVALREIPASVSVLTRQRMDDQNVTTIQQGLRYVTGVESIDYGDGTAYFRARGNQMGIEFDGVSIMNGLQYQQQFDMAMYDRVEVMRGPAGVTDDAIGQPGGTVNLVRKRPMDEFHLSGETQVGTFGSVRQMFDVTGPLNNEGTLRGRAVMAGNNSLQSTDDTRNKNGMLYAALDYDVSPQTTLSLSAGYQVTSIKGLDYGAPGVVNASGTALIGGLSGSPSENYSPDWNRSHVAIKEVNANLTHRFDNGWNWDTTTFYRSGSLSAKYAYSSPGATQQGLSEFGDQRQSSETE